MITKETIRIKLRKFYINKTSKLRSRKIKSDDFTIISNNCWGGFVYQSYGLKYNTPTIGLFFMSDDYIEFVSNIKKWIYQPIEFINYEKSKYYEHFKGWNKFGTYPIGKFVDSDIEIHFLHYSSENNASKCWNRRVERINWGKILYKFNDQNLCRFEHLRKFNELSYDNKICFTSKFYSLTNTVYIKKAKKYLEIPASYEPLGKSRNIDINNLINNL